MHSQYMTKDFKMFNSIISKICIDFVNTTFGDNDKGKVIILGKTAISNDLSISNVLLVES
jgi:hypothetical protein